MNEFPRAVAKGGVCCELDQGLECKWLDTVMRVETSSVKGCVERARRGPPTRGQCVSGGLARNLGARLLDQAVQGGGHKPAARTRRD